MDKPTFYQIRIKSHLDDTWAESFEGLTISNLEDGGALLTGFIPDQPLCKAFSNGSAIWD